jgi:hypothetical protein
LSQRYTSLRDGTPVVEIDATSGNEEHTLTSGFTPGRQYIVMRLDGSANTVTVQAENGDTLNGTTNGSVAIPPRESVTFDRLDAAWRTVGFGGAEQGSGASIADGSITANKLGADVPAALAPDIATELALGDVATLDVGTTAGTVAAGDDTRIVGAAQKSANLSDLGSAPTSRTNLGLGTSATRDVGTGTGQVAAGDDARLSDQRVPTDGSVTFTKLAGSAPAALAADPAFTDEYAPLYSDNDIRRYLDGAPNDATALVNALAAIGAGGELIIPEDVALSLGASVVSVTSRTIRGPGTITGTGTAVLTMAGTRPRAVGLTLKSDGTQVLNVAAGCTGLEVKECLIGSANGSSTPQGIQINVTGVSDGRIADNLFQHVSYGVLTNSSATDLTNLEISGNTFREVFSDPIELNHPGTAYTGAHNVRIHGNDIVADQGSSGSSGFGVGIAGAVGVTVSGNLFGYCRQQAVHIEDEAKHIVVSGNVILEPVDGIKVFGGDWITISDNEIYNPSGYGIHLVQDVSNQPTHWSIHDNGVYQAGVSGIYVNADNPHYGLLIDNRVDGSTGSNIVYRGTSTGVLYGPARVEGNISSNSGAYGMELLGHIGSHVGHNVFRGNASGDYLRQTSTPAVRVPVNCPSGEGTGTSTSNLTDWVGLIDVGDRAAGVLTVSALGSNNAGVRCQLVAQMDWDGTTLTVTPIGSEIAAGGLSALAFQVTSGRLQARVAITGADGQTVRFWGALQGTALI